MTSSLSCPHCGRDWTGFAGVDVTVQSPSGTQYELNNQSLTQQGTLEIDGFNAEVDRALVRCGGCGLAADQLQGLTSPRRLPFDSHD